MSKTWTRYNERYFRSIAQFSSEPVWLRYVREDHALMANYAFMRASQRRVAARCCEVATQAADHNKNPPKTSNTVKSAETNLCRRRREGRWHPSAHLPWDYVRPPRCFGDLFGRYTTLPLCGRPKVDNCAHSHLIPGVRHKQTNQTIFAIGVGARSM